MIPYKEASDEIRRQGELPVKAFGKGLGIAAGFSQVLPFLNSLIPEEISIKGLSKINPRLGGFVKKALKSGYGLDEIKSFIKEKGESSEEKQNAPFSIRKVNPRLAEEIETTMSRGYDPLQTAAVISNSSRFSKDIKDIQKKTNRKIEDLISEEFQQATGGNSSPRQQNPQQSQGQDRLMQLLQKLNQARGR